ncbi:hypothetical protein LTR27_009713 [Elasticomyces elasticus]|nr:hypothetical protein LTR27_009713 [Elasticomyces elasticus]
MAATLSTIATSTDNVVEFWRKMNAPVYTYHSLQDLPGMMQWPRYAERRRLLEPVMFGRRHDQKLGASCAMDYNIILAEGGDTWLEQVFKRLYGIPSAAYPRVHGNWDLEFLLDVRAAVMLNGVRRKKDFLREPRFVAELDWFVQAISPDDKGAQASYTGTTVWELRLKAEKLFPRRRLSDQGLILE